MMNRSTYRALHIIAAILLGTYIYSPWSSIEWFDLAIRGFVFPALALSGVWMWKGRQIKSALFTRT